MILVVPEYVSANSNPWWDVQSIDTMKYSRDPSREFLSDPEKASEVITEQVGHVADTGATHIAISTPYDEEFRPLLREWVAEARKHDLKVWFRGNWSGWENWFGYNDITPEEHVTKTVAFIQQNQDLFEDGDIFSGCPECENGGPGDPRMTDGKIRHQQFLIKQYESATAAFQKIDKDVDAGYHSMNGDVAKLVMDRPTTKAAGGLIVVDHYVRTPEQLIKDVIQYASQSGGQVVLGEFGAPIPDIHGSMTEQQQAEWLEQSLAGLSKVESLKGMNYWTGMGGSTAIWNEDNTPRQAVAVLKKYFSPKVITGKVVNTVGNPVPSATLVTAEQERKTTEKGEFTIPYINSEEMVSITAFDHLPRNVRIDQLQADSTIVMAPEEHGWWYSLRLWVIRLFE